MVAVGETLTEPFTGRLPTPLSMVTLVAFEVVQASVELAPSLIEEGVAVKLVIEGASELTATVTVDGALVPAGPVAVSV